MFAPINPRIPPSSICMDPLLKMPPPGITSKSKFPPLAKLRALASEKWAAATTRLLALIVDPSWKMKPGPVKKTSPWLTFMVPQIFAGWSPPTLKTDFDPALCWETLTVCPRAML